MAEKSEGAMLTIGEVADRLNIKAHILRYWEEQFPMLQPLKRAGGRRYYRPADVALLEQIDRLLNAEGYTIKGAVAALKSKRAGANTPPDAVPEAMSTLQGYPPAGEDIGGGLNVHGAGKGLSPEVRQKLEATRDKLSKALSQS